MSNEELKQRQSALLDSYGIFELRTIGRYYGVESPTTLNRKELKEEIIKCLELYPNGAPTRVSAGRPIKELNNVNELIASLRFDTISLGPVSTLTNSYFNFSQLDSAIAEDVATEVSGVVLENKEVMLDFDTRKNVTLPIDCKHLLRVGDICTGVGVFSKVDDAFKCREITKINGQDVATYEQPMLHVSHTVLPSSTFKFLSKDIIVGGNNAFEFGLNYFNRQSLISALAALTRTYDVVILGAGLSKEDYLTFQGISGTKNFLSSIQDKPNVSYMQIVSCMNYILRSSMIGHNVVLFTFNLPTLMSNLKITEKFDTKQPLSDDIMKTFQSLAKATDKDNNITIVNTFQKVDLSNEQFMEIVYKTSNLN